MNNINGIVIVKGGLTSILSKSWDEQGESQIICPVCGNNCVDTNEIEWVSLGLDSYNPLGSRGPIGLQLFKCEANHSFAIAWLPHKGDMFAKVLTIDTGNKIVSDALHFAITEGEDESALRVWRVLIEGKPIGE